MILCEGAKLKAAHYTYVEVTGIWLEEGNWWFFNLGKQQALVYTPNIYIQGDAFMTLARVFQSGNSQAVRLPKEFRFDVDEVEIFRRGDEIILRAATPNAAAIFDTLAKLPSDFLDEGREDTPPQERDSF